MNCLFTGWHCHCVLNHLPTDFHPPWARQNGISGPNRVSLFFKDRIGLSFYVTPIHIPGSLSFQWRKVCQCISETSCVFRGPFLDLAAHSFAALFRKVILPPQMASENLSQESAWHNWTLAGISVQLPANTPGNVNTFFHLLSCLQFALGGLGLGKHQYFDVMTW